MTQSLETNNAIYRDSLTLSVISCRCIECQSLFFNKVEGFMPATSLKKRLWHRCFPVDFAKFLWTPLLQNTFGRLVLYSEPSQICKMQFYEKILNGWKSLNIFAKSFVLYLMENFILCAVIHVFILEVFMDYLEKPT